MFAAPWTGTVYERSIQSLIDPSSQVLHHWLLFKQTTPAADGSVSPGTGVHPDGIVLHAWAPGATPVYLDPDVGVALESTLTYQLEAHYNNPTGAPGNDGSGAEVCATTKMPVHLAELSWLGTDAIAGLGASGTCIPTGPGSDGPIHIILAQPHMHKTGTHMKVTVNRASGMAEVIHDKPFSFDDQRFYPEDVVIMPGDTITTDCTYSAPATFGQSTSNEMCYFFSLHWPAGALTGGTGAFIHGADSCL
jgi:hypothetical protein